MESIALIPAFNEEKTIAEVISRLKKIDLDFIVIDDGSTDRTYEIVKKSGTTVIRHEKNKGKGEALKTGFTHVMYNYPDVKNVVLVDSDLQYDPEDSLKLLKPLENGSADFVMGYRDWSTVPFRHRLGNLVWRTSFNSFFGTEFKDTNCGIMALSRKAIETIKGTYGGYIIENKMLMDMLKNDLKIEQVPVRVHYKRKKGILGGLRMVLGCLIFILREGIKYRLGKL